MYLNYMYIAHILHLHGNLYYDIVLPDKAKLPALKPANRKKNNGSSHNNTTGILGSNQPPRRRAPHQGLQAVKESLPTTTLSGTTPEGAITSGLTG